MIGLFLKCWDVATCIRTFDLLVRDFFGLHLTKGRGLITRLRNYFRCWLSDGCYDVNALERSLKDVFGEDRRMFDAPESGVSGCKVAVTATTISDAYTYVFSNYNGNGIRDRACGGSRTSIKAFLADLVLQVTSIFDQRPLTRSHSYGKRKLPHSV